jgi:hypothetical protein
MSSKFWIDKVHGCSLDQCGDINDLLNELSNLEKLQNGLFSIAMTVKSLEKQEFERRKLSERSITIGFGMPEGTHASEQELLLPNYFHWFANDLINYVRLAGFTMHRINGTITHEMIRSDSDKVKGFVNEYVKSVTEIDEMKIWRNKVSAHFAITAPLSENPAILYHSILQPIAFWMNMRFTMNTVIIDGMTEADMPQWSLTEVFERLFERYWPEGHDFFQQRCPGFVVPPKF